MTRVLGWLGLALLAASGCAHLPDAASERDAAPPPTAAELLEVAALAERLGDRLRAQQYLNAAKRAGADPDIVTPHLVRLYIADSQYRLAIDCVRERLKALPEHTALRFLLARLYEATDLETAAVSEYERVLTEKPNEPRAHLALALLLRRTGQDPGRVDRHLRAYIELEPNAPEAIEARASLMKEMP